MSCPAFLVNGPFCPKPFILAYTSLGLSDKSLSGPRPNFSIIPTKWKSSNCNLLFKHNSNSVITYFKDSRIVCS